MAEAPESLTDRNSKNDVIPMIRKEAQSSFNGGFLGLIEKEERETEQIEKKN